MKTFYCLVILLFSANLTYANELSLDKNNKVDEKTEKRESSVGTEGHVLGLNDKKDDILIDENLSIDQQDLKSENSMPNKDSKKDKNPVLQEEKDAEVFDLENQKNDQKKKLGNDIEPNKNLLHKMQQAPSTSMADELDKDNKNNSKKSDTPYDADNDKAKDSDDENYESFKFPQWENLLKDDIAVWKYKEVPNIAIYNKVSEDNNNHLPRATYLQDYSKQIYYCIVKDDLSGLRAIVNKLKDVGMTVNDILELKPDSTNDLLTFAMKTGKRDIVDFLLYKGAVFNANNSEELLSSATQYGYFDLVDLIKKIRNSSFKKINNDLNSDMYKWAVETKYSNVNK